jgi:hypothetical protein
MRSRPRDGDPIDDRQAETGEDAVLGDDDARGQELGQRHGGGVVGVAPVAELQVGVVAQDVLGLWRQVVADLQVHDPANRQDLLPQQSAGIALGHRIVGSDLAKAFLDLARDVGSDVGLARPVPASPVNLSCCRPCLTK